MTKAREQQLTDALAGLFGGVLDCEDTSAMPDGSEVDGVEHQSFWVAGNVGYAEMLAAAQALGRKFSRDYTKTQPKELVGKLYQSKVEDKEEDDEYGEVTHPVGSIFRVHAYHEGDELFTVAWLGIALDAAGKPVPAKGQWTRWTLDEIVRDAVEVA